MAFYTIEKRLRRDGTARYRCTVGVKEAGEYKYRESKTFSRSALAKSWGVQRVAEIESGGIPEKSAGITLGELIRRYLANNDIPKGDDKKGRLRRLEVSELAKIQLRDIKMSDYINHATFRRATCSGSTLNTDLAALKTVLDAAMPFFNIDPNISEFINARKYLITMKIIHPSNKRNRRISHSEVDLLMAELKNKADNSRNGIPYDLIFDFALHSCMRLGEICRLRWDDLDRKTQSILIRDRKDPRKKKGNHMFAPLLGRAWEIVIAQPEISEYIFPYNKVTISQLFQDIKEKIGLKDVRFHDARREAASRLFELGMSVEEVAQVTGHRNIQTLWTIYREIYPQTLHDRFAELQKRNKPEE
ncbi:site-specific integrase [Salmonella enterica]|nr:site-specific integrase [Salmonella enterica]EAT3568297.1 site-specific integrase [Salmonella enterica]ECU0901159.1 site-specific integrase [Salmonella enterica]EDI8914338.1 site-specific integrase [Salmonella enterica]EFB0102711.1 site-specific integrase [Salmonella enterica]